MNKAKFIEKLEGCGFPKSEYIILSGGSLLMRGLREETADIDLAVSEALANKLDLGNCPRNEKGYYAPFDDIEIKADLKGRAFDIIGGYKCQTLEDILALKRRLMRPKDIKDIAAIEEWINSHSVTAEA